MHSSYISCKVFPLVAAHCLGAHTLANSCLINLKQSRNSVLEFVLLDVSIHLQFFFFGGGRERRGGGKRRQKKCK